MVYLSKTYILFILFCSSMVCLVLLFCRIIICRITRKVSWISKLLSIPKLLIALFFLSMISILVCSYHAKKQFESLLEDLKSCTSIKISHHYLPDKTIEEYIVNDKDEIFALYESIKNKSYLRLSPLAYRTTPITTFTFVSLYRQDKEVRMFGFMNFDYIHLNYLSIYQPKNHSFLNEIQNIRSSGIYDVNN